MRNMIRSHTVGRVLAGWTAVILLTMSITASALAGETESTSDEGSMDAVDEIVCDHSYDEETASWTWAELEESGYCATLTLTCAICGETASTSAVAVLTDEQAAGETVEGWALYSATATIGDVTVEDSFIVTLSIAEASGEEPEAVQDTSSEDDTSDGEDDVSGEESTSDEENDESEDDEALETAASYLVTQEVTVTEEAAAAAVAAETTEDAEAEADESSNEEAQTESTETSIPEDAVTFNGHYYYLIPNTDSEFTSFDAAKEYCESLGGYLATITSEEEDEFLYNYVLDCGYLNAYFGLTDEYEEGTWVWVNGEEVTYTNWHSGEANSQNSGEDYGMYYWKFRDGTWNDGDFGEEKRRSFLCEWGDYEIDNAWDVTISSEEISSTNYTAIYEITASFTNTTSWLSLENIRAVLDPMDNAEILTDYGEQVQRVGELGAEETVEMIWRIEIDRTAYPNGGEYNYTVYYGGDSLSYVSLNGTICLDAVESNLSEEILGFDVWSFKNFSHFTHSLTESLYKELTNSVSISELLMMSLDGLVNSGHCYGMSVSVVLQNVGAADITSYTGTDTLWHADRDENDTESIICYYHILQLASGPISDMLYYRSLNVDTQLKLLETYLSENSLVLFEVGSDMGAHAVVAFGLEEGEYYLDCTGIEYDRKVLLYDCNYPNEVSYFYFDSETFDWAMPDYVSKYEFFSGGNQNAYLKRCTTNLNVMRNSMTGSDYSYYFSGVLLRLASNTVVEISSESGSWKTGKTGSVEGTSDITYYNDSDISDDGACGDRVVLLPSDEEEYTIVTESGEAEELDIGVKYEDRYISVEAVAAVGVSFSADGAVTLLGNEGEFEIRIADDNVADGEFDVYYISGDSEGDIVIEMGEDDISVSADTISGITIEAFEGDVEDSITITADVTNVVFGRSDNDELYCESHTAGESVTENRSEATCVEDGAYDEVVYCVICGAEISRTTTVIAATGHNFVSGVCSVCGYRNDNDSDGTSDSSGTASAVSSDTDSSDSSGSVLVSADISDAGEDETASAGSLTDAGMSEDSEQSDADLEGNAGNGGETQNAARGEAATGDDSNVLLWFGLMMLSAASLGVVIASRRRRSR